MVLSDCLKLWTRLINNPIITLREYAGRVSPVSQHLHQVQDTLRLLHCQPSKVSLQRLGMELKGHSTITFLTALAVLISPKIFFLFSFW